MADYHINVFWSDEDGCYVADIPDLSYCSAFGDTPEEALKRPGFHGDFLPMKWRKDHGNQAPLIEAVPA